VIEEGLGYFRIFEEGGTKVKTSSPLATSEMAFKEGDNHACGKSSITVRAKAVDVLAYVWNFGSRSDWAAEDLGKAVLEERKNNHNKVVCTCKSMPARLTNREYVGRMLWKRLDKDNFVFVTKPTDHKGRKKTSEFVRGSFPSCMKMERLSENETSIDWICHPSAGGSVPSWIGNYLMGEQLEYTADVQQFFQQLRGLKELDAADGVAIGEHFMIKANAEKRMTKAKKNAAVRVPEMMANHKSLKELGEQHEVG
jgi:hypothetical protein